MIKAGLVINDYEFIEQIGKGGYSSVWKVRSQRFDRIFVAKIAIAKGDVEKAWQAFDREIQALMRLYHPNIVSLYAYFRHLENFIMILEYLPNGSLEDWMRINGRLSGMMLIRTVREICLALIYARSKGVQHHDIKPANIMFDESGRAKLVDFGISIVGIGSEEATKVSDYKCSLVCAAPEILRKRPYCPVKSDVWALGITILWMAKGSVPWQFRTVHELIDKIRIGDYVFEKGMNRSVLRIARGMLAISPGDRMFPSEDVLNNLGGLPPCGTLNKRCGLKVGQPSCLTTIMSHSIMQQTSLRKLGPLNLKVVRPSPTLPNQQARSFFGQVEETHLGFPPLVLAQ